MGRRRSRLDGWRPGQPTIEIFTVRPVSVNGRFALEPLVESVAYCPFCDTYSTDGDGVTVAEFLTHTCDPL